VAKRNLQPVIIVDESGHVPISRLREVARNPKRILDEDEADYQAALASIRKGGKTISLEALLKKHGYR
jgi:hypothetical protein